MYVVTMDICDVLSCSPVVLFSDAIMFGLSHETAFTDSAHPSRHAFPFATIERTVRPLSPSCYMFLLYLCMYVQYVYVSLSPRLMCSCIIF